MPVIPILRQFKVPIYSLVHLSAVALKVSDEHGDNWGCSPSFAPCVDGREAASLDVHMKARPGPMTMASWQQQLVHGPSVCRLPIRLSNSDLFCVGCFKVEHSTAGMDIR